MKKLWQSTLLGFFVTSFSGCALMLPDRSFIQEMEREEETFFRPGKDFPVMSGDTGEDYRSRQEILNRTPKSERERGLARENSSLVEELARKESELEEDEVKRYTYDKPFLQTVSDKIYYLDLSPSDRREYIRSKKQDLKEDLDQKRNLVQRRSIHSAELFLGMAKAEVIEVWGKPAKIEIAGNPSLENERWSFVEDGSVKQVYFEGGKLQGWALDL